MIFPSTTTVLTANNLLLISPNARCTGKDKFAMSVGIRSIYDDSLLRIDLCDIEEFASAVVEAAEAAKRWESEGVPQKIVELLTNTGDDDDDDTFEEVEE